MTSSCPDTWMPFYMGDFEASTASLSDAEKWNYLKVIFEYWRLAHKGEKIVFDKISIKFICKISLKKSSKLLMFFQCKDGFLYHPRIEKEIAKAIETKVKNTKKTAAATAARKAKNDNRNEQRNVDGNDLGNDHPTTTTTTLTQQRVKTLCVSKARARTHSFENLVLEKEFSEVARTAGLEADPAAKCWQKFKVYFEARPPDNPLSAWKKWVLDERKAPPDPDIPREFTDEEKLIQRLGVANWTRNMPNLALNPSEKAFLEGWERGNGKVDWINFDDWKEKKK